MRSDSMKICTTVVLTLLLNLPIFAHLKVMTTTFTLNALTKSIGQDEIELTRLLPSGVDLHHFEPKVSTFTKLTRADLVFYNGLGLDSWLEKFLANQPEIKAINMSKKVPVLLTATSDHHHGHEEAKHDEDDDHDEDHKDNDEHADHDEDHESNANHDEHDDEHDQMSYDMHYWLDITNVKAMAATIKANLIVIKPSAKAKFESNFKNLIVQLDDLDQSLQHLKSCPRKHFITSHNAYNYLAKAYGLTNLGLASLDNESQISAKTVIKLIEISKKYQLKHVLLEPLVNQKTAMSLVSQAKLKPLYIDPLANSVGDDFVKAMRKNLQQLKIALAC